MEAETKKTGTTPIVEEGVGAGEILGAVELKPIMVKLRDGHGVEMVKIGFIIPGGDLYFIDEKTLGKPAQSWVKNGVLRKMGLRE